MVAIDIFFFFSSSLIGFLYHWFLYSAPKWATVFSNCLLLFFLIVAIALGIAAISALPGDDLYTLKRIFFSYFGGQILVGFPFGFLFRVWLARAPQILPTLRTFQFHIPYAIMLTALLLIGIFLGPLTAMLPRLSGINTPVVSLDFSNPVQSERDEDTVIRSPSKGNSESARIVIHMDEILERDNEYSRLLHGDPSKQLEGLQTESKDTIGLLVKCFESLLDDKNVETGSGAGLLPWSRLISEVYIADDITNFENAFFKFIKGDCPSFPQESLSRLQDLPHMSLILAHLLQINGHPQVGAKIIARWIDTHDNESKHNPGWHVPSWYRNRAFVHLSLLIASYGDHQAAYNAGLRSVESLEDAMKESQRNELRNWHTWRQRCLNGLPLEVNDEEKKDLIFVDQIYMTLISQSDILVHAAMDIDRDDDTLLKYAKRNAGLPMRCYRHLLGDKFVKLYKAHYLAGYGKLLLSLAEKKYFLNIRGKVDRQTYLDGRAYLLRALTMLQLPVAVERAEIENSRVEDALEPYIARDMSEDIKRELERVEKALNIR